MAEPVPSVQTRATTRAMSSKATASHTETVSESRHDQGSASGSSHRSGPRTRSNSNSPPARADTPHPLGSHVEAQQEPAAPAAAAPKRKRLRDDSGESQNAKRNKAAPAPSKRKRGPSDDESQDSQEGDDSGPPKPKRGKKTVPETQTGANKRATTAAAKRKRGQGDGSAQNNKRKRGNDKDDDAYVEPEGEDEDDDDDENEDHGEGGEGGEDGQEEQPPPRKARKPRQKRVKQEGGREVKFKACHFCASDPQGQLMAATRPCDWYMVGKHTIECSNCADHRHGHPEAEHECKISRRKHVWRRYAAEDRDDYAPSACDHCVSISRGGACDVDTTLGYSCGKCLKSECRVGGRLMERRPNLRQGCERWFRHACDTCDNKMAKKGEPGCSWLGNRHSWGRPCTRCETNKMTCWNSGHVVAHPPEPNLPTSWSVSHTLNGGWAELRGGSPWRKNCTNCAINNNHCRAMADAATTACNRCMQMGLDCLDAQGNSYPLPDLSRVGFGNFMPFRACTRCIATGRNCDRQRPCDSCVINGEAHLCDSFELGSRSNFNCHNGRFDPAPGPVYYLALGYGAGGVNDPKDGSRLEHWIGPGFPIYSMVGDRDSNRMVVVAIAEEMARALRPEGVPPHGHRGGALEHTRPSQMSVQDLVRWMTDNWPGASIPSHYNSFVQAVSAARGKRALYARGEGQSRRRNRRGASRALGPGAVVVEVHDDADADADVDAEGELVFDANVDTVAEAGIAAAGANNAEPNHQEALGEAGQPGDERAEADARNGSDEADMDPNAPGGGGGGGGGGDDDDDDDDAHDGNRGDGRGGGRVPLHDRGHASSGGKDGQQGPARGDEVVALVGEANIHAQEANAPVNPLNFDQPYSQLDPFDGPNGFERSAFDGQADALADQQRLLERQQRQQQHFDNAAGLAHGAAAQPQGEPDPLADLDLSELLYISPERERIRQDSAEQDPLLWTPERLASDLMRGSARRDDPLFSEPDMSHFGQGNAGQIFGAPEQQHVTVGRDSPGSRASPSHPANQRGDNSAFHGLTDEEMDYLSQQQLAHEMTGLGPPPGAFEDGSDFQIPSDGTINPDAIYISPGRRARLAALEAQNVGAPENASPTGNHQAQSGGHVLSLQPSVAPQPRHDNASVSRLQDGTQVSAGPVQGPANATSPVICHFRRPLARRTNRQHRQRAYEAGLLLPPQTSAGPRPSPSSSSSFQPPPAQSLAGQSSGHQHPATEPSTQTALVRFTRWSPHIDPRNIGTWSSANRRSADGPSNQARVRLFENSHQSVRRTSQVPVRNVFGNTPLMSQSASSIGGEPDGARQCDEPSLTGNGKCDCPIGDHQVCASVDHVHLTGQEWGVCDPCAQDNTDVVVGLRGEWKGVEPQELLNMRAYFCNSCAASYSRNIGSLRRMLLHGANTVWGSGFADGLEVQGTLTVNNNPVHFRKDALPVTGCSCATKMFKQRLCRNHRCFFIEQAFSNVEAVRNWRNENLGGDRCAGCLLTMSPGQANVGDGQPDAYNQPVAWVCMQCNDAVVNQRGSGLVPGWESWFSRAPQGWAAATNRAPGDPEPMGE